MATINYTAEHNVAAGYVKVEWSNLSEGDDGQPFECGGLRIGSIQARGTFNSGALIIEGSNEVAPSNFTGVVSFTGPEVRNLEAHDEAEHVGAVRPLFTNDEGGSVKA